MIDLLLGPLVFIGYVVVVGVALVLALVVFSTGGGAERRTERRFSRSRSWWRQWR